MMKHLRSTLFLLAFMPMCSSPNEATYEAFHDNGLQVELPQTVSFQRTTDGFLIQPLNSQELRFPFRMTISLSSSQDLSKEKWDFKEINGQLIYFRIEEFSGGSGGQIYVLKAFKITPEFYISLEQTVQAEFLNQGTFRLGWTIIKDAKILSSDSSD